MNSFGEGAGEGSRESGSSGEGFAEISRGREVRFSFPSPRLVFFLFCGLSFMFYISQFLPLFLSFSFFVVAVSISCSTVFPCSFMKDF